MAGPILSFSDSDGSDDEIGSLINKKKSVIGFKTRTAKTKRANDDNVGADNIKNMNHLNTKRIENEKEDDEEEDKEFQVRIKRKTVNFQLNKHTIKQNDNKNINDLMSQYGNISLQSQSKSQSQSQLQSAATDQFDDTVEGFYLSSESEVDENLELENQTVDQKRSHIQEESSEMNIREIETQMLNEEFIPEGIENAKKTRAVLERDYTALQLDDQGSKLDEEVLAISRSDIVKRDQERRMLIQNALEQNSSDESLSMDNYDKKDDTLVMISSNKTMVTYSASPKFDNAYDLLSSKVEQLKALKATRETKLQHFTREFDQMKLNTLEGSMQEVIRLARLKKLPN